MAILEINYRARVGWAHPIRRAIDGNPILAARDKSWRKGALSDLAFAIETRLMYLPQIITFIDDNIGELRQELIRPHVQLHLNRGAAFTFTNARATHRVLFATTAFVTESRSCFENLAGFYQLFLETYCDRTITKRQSYNVVSRCTGKYAWSSALRRIRGDLIHSRSLFLAYEVNASVTAWTPIFSMNWRPGHFGKNDRIDLPTLAGIWEGLYAAASAMSRKIVNIAATRRR